MSRRLKSPILIRRGCRRAPARWRIVCHDLRSGQQYDFRLYATSDAGIFESERGRTVRALDVAEFIFLLLLGGDGDQPA